ncbi:MAG: DUF2336 domain-containing protein [Pseudomonadota bacterium]
MAADLSAADVAQLANAKTDPRVRAEMIGKVSASFAGGSLSPSERALAEDIFRAMARDVEVRVRHAMMDALKDSPDVPRDVAMKMATDVAEVAVPFLEMTTVLTDEDLIEIIRSQGQDHQIAVARRSSVSEAVSDALVETNNEAVVATLVSNSGAQLSEATMSKVLDSFGHVKPIATSMAERNALPLPIAERLVTLVSAKMQSHLEKASGLNKKTAKAVGVEAREKATVSLLDGSHDAPDIHALVDQLHKSGRLTHTLVVRALCMGDMVFFETGLARLAGIPVSNVYRLIHEKGTKGLERLFIKLGVDKKMFEIALVALDLSKDLKLDSRDDREHFRSVMLDRVLTKLGETQDVDSLDFLMRKIGHSGARKAA